MQDNATTAPLKGSQFGRVDSHSHDDPGLVKTSSTAAQMKGSGQMFGNKHAPPSPLDQNMIESPLPQRACPAQNTRRLDSIDNSLLFHTLPIIRQATYVSINLLSIITLALSISWYFLSRGTSSPFSSPFFFATHPTRAAPPQKHANIVIDLFISSLGSIVIAGNLPKPWISKKTVYDPLKTGWIASNILKQIDTITSFKMK